MSGAGKEYGQFVKQRREERYSQFVTSILPAIKSLGYEVIQRNDYGFEFIVPKKGFGWVIFYPKGNRLLLCKQNKWLYGGFSWIRKHILKNNGSMQNRCADRYSAS